MSVSTHPSEPRPKLESFGTETDRRLVLLMVAVLAASIYMLHVELLTTLLSGMFQHCAQLAANPQVDVSMRTPDALPRACSVVPERWQCLGIFLGLLILLSVWVLIYWIQPLWHIKDAKLTPLEPPQEAMIECDGEQVHIMTFLERMRKKHLPPNVHLRYMTTSNIQKVPWVFCGLGQAYLVVPSQTIILFQQDFPEFRATLLHELAHFHHRDVQKTCLAEALALAFGLVILLPYLGFTLWSLAFVSASLAPFAGVEFVLSQFWQALVMVGLVWVLYLAVRRTREIAADVQASYWAGAHTALETVLLRLDRGRRAWWRVALDYYPDERVLNVQEPGRRLFRLRYWEALAIGITASLSLGTLFFTVLTVFSALNLSASLPIWVLAGFVGAFVLCVLVVAALGQMIWRAVLLEKLRGTDQLIGTGRVGFCITVGLVLGFLCSQQFSPFLVYYHASWQTLVAYVGPLVLVLVLVLGSFCQWLAVLANVWLEVIDGEGMARWVSRVNLMVACVMLATGLAIVIVLCLVTLGFLLQHVSNSQMLFQPIELRIADVPAFYVTLMLFVFSMMQQPWIALGLTVLWIVPLSSCFWSLRRTSIDPYTWALADPKQPVLSRPRSSPFDWGLLSETVLVLGVFFSALFVFFHQVSLALADAEQLLPYVLAITIVPTLIAGVWQGAVAALLYREMDKRGLTNGLMGAFLVGLVIAAGYFLVYHLFGGTLGAPVGTDLFWPICWQVLSCGSISTWVVLWALNGWLKKEHHESTGETGIENGVETTPWQTLAHEHPVPGERTGNRPRDGRWRRRWLWLVSLVLIIIALLLPRYVSKPTSVAFTGLVRNGDFETPRVPVGNFNEYSAGQTFGGWNVAAGSVDLTDEHYWQSGHGKQSVDMNGNSAGALYQDLPTTAGATYTLAFLFAANPECGNTVKVLQLWWGGTLLDTIRVSPNGHNDQHMNWHHSLVDATHTAVKLTFPYVVQATANTTRLEFVSLTPGYCGAVIDLVSVMETSAE